MQSGSSERLSQRMGKTDPGKRRLNIYNVRYNWVTIILVFSSPISLTVAKCWDPSPRSYFTIPRGQYTQTHFFQIRKHHALTCSAFFFSKAEPVRPIDPAAWISHTTALTGSYPQNGTVYSIWQVTFTASSFLQSMMLIILLSFTEFDDLPLTVGKTDMATIVKVMQLPDSGLEIRDRMWLKITIANAVIGKLSFSSYLWDLRTHVTKMMFAE